MSEETSSGTFSFLKGAEDILAPLKNEDQPFDWDQAAGTVRQNLGDAMNARHLAFLFGSGCSSMRSGDNIELGIPTMAPMAKGFLEEQPEQANEQFITIAERLALKEGLGLNLEADEFMGNLERLMEFLFSARFVLKGAKDGSLAELGKTVESAIRKTTAHILKQCTDGYFSLFDDSVLNLYQAFYQKLVFRDRSLPRPWVFTTNYDLFNETAMDRRGIPYCNGFSGTVERRFNPTVFRYSLAEQLDITSRKWSAVDSFVYLCKLHGSVNWVEDGQTLFPIREQHGEIAPSSRVMIYPTPAKQSASLASPYADLFREFHGRIIRDQSVLVTVGYGFGDEHVNNIIFQALTIPNFRLVAFVPPDADGVVKKLRGLADPRIWLIGGEGATPQRRAHYFDTFVESFMPETPSDKIEKAVSNVLQKLIAPEASPSEDKGDGT